MIPMLIASFTMTVVVVEVKVGVIVVVVEVGVVTCMCAWLDPLGTKPRTCRHSYRTTGLETETGPRLGLVSSFCSGVRVGIRVRVRGSIRLRLSIRFRLVLKVRVTRICARRLCD